MPIVINELVIKAAIAGQNEGQTPRGPDHDASSDRDELVETCVEEVLKVLQRQHER